MYFSGCPNVEEARDRVRSALQIEGDPVQWAEWDLASVTAPQRFRGFPSPTVLVDGSDVSGFDDDTDGRFSCRRDGPPSTEAVLRALRRE